MDYHIYILKCNDGTYYVGHTNNVQRRLEEHQSKQYNGYTAFRLPVKLVYVQTFKSRHDAFTFERQIKNWSKKKKEALINGQWKEVSKLSKKKFNLIPSVRRNS